MLATTPLHAGSPTFEAPPGAEFAPPFDRLVAAGTLTDAQARLVVQALHDEAASSVASARPKSGLAGRLAEVGAYLGAALVVAAGIVVVAQQWVDMGYATRVAVMAGTTMALVVAALVMSSMIGGRPGLGAASGATIRRLSGVLFTLGALAAWGTVLTALLSGEEYVSEAEASMAFMVAGAVALAILVLGRLRADTPLGELGMVAASVSIVAGAIQFWFTDRPVAIQWSLLALGLAWALIATFTPLMRHETLVSALGLVLALFGAATIAEVTWSHRLALSVLIAATLTVYLVRPMWPYIAAGTIAAVVLTVTWVGEAVGVAMALLAAGVVVLVLAGGALLLHVRRRPDRDAESADQHETGRDRS